MPKFRKKPVVVEAVQFDGSHASYSAIVETWPVEGMAWFAQTATMANVMTIPTLEGVMCAQAGDWIIRGVQGEVYPCKPDIFAQTYEPADTHQLESCVGRKREGA